MTGPAKILAIDDEADIERLIRQRFSHQHRSPAAGADSQKRRSSLAIC